MAPGCRAEGERAGLVVRVQSSHASTLPWLCNEYVSD